MTDTTVIKEYVHARSVTFRKDALLTVDDEVQLYVVDMDAEMVRFRVIPNQWEFAVSLGPLEAGEIPGGKGKYGRGASVRITKIQVGKQIAKGYILSQMLGRAYEAVDE